VGATGKRSLQVAREQAEEESMHDGAKNTGLIWVYAATIFLSALLLFLVQPIISRFILPWFGGAPAVWTAAMLFFQTMLLAGYAYAHLSERYFPQRLRGAIHVMLLGAAVLALPFVPSERWKPLDGSQPVLHILVLLGACVGLPYFVLSTTGPLVQAWFSRRYPGISPYRLYSLSNVGSLLALLAYPFVVEPNLTLGRQAAMWQSAFWVFAALCAWGAIRMATQQRANQPMTQREKKKLRAAGIALEPAATIEEPVERPLWRQEFLWLALPAFASLSFLAATNHVCQDFPPVPFLYIVPLGLYLLSFVICFDHERWYKPRILATILLLLYVAAATYTAIYHSDDSRLRERFVFDVAVSFVGLFIVCLLCHGELVRLKPHPRRLTTFYLLIAAGGAMGGLFVSLIAPLVFRSFGEWYIAVGGGCLLAVAALLGTDQNGFFRRYPYIFLPGFLILAGCMAWGVHRATAGDQPIEVVRNFYGVLTVKAEKETYNGKSELTTVLLNGQIRHGMQFQSKKLRTLPTTYYAKKSGVGRVIDFFDDLPSLRVGVIGLGTGTLAAYFKPNDHFVFYEINQLEREVCERNFTYLADAKERKKFGAGDLEVEMGDARLSLERDLTTKPPRQFHVIVVDAFSGDAIPTHLLTKEAGDIYLRQLDPQGVLAIHISNRYLDLKPVVRGLADYLGLTPVKVWNDSDPDAGISAADWMLLTKNQEFLRKLKAGSDADFKFDGPMRKWTDDFSDLFSILREDKPATSAEEPPNEPDK
jgi:hypothetical protein